MIEGTWNCPGCGETREIEPLPDRLTGRPQDFGSCCAGSIPAPGMTPAELEYVTELVQQLLDGPYSEHLRVHVEILAWHLRTLLMTGAVDYHRCRQTVMILRDTIGNLDYGVSMAITALQLFISDKDPLHADA